MKTIKFLSIIMVLTLIYSCSNDDNNTIPQEEPTVYVVGTQENTAGVSVVTLWINGVPQEITDGVNEAFVSSIYVDDDDVYISGSEVIGNTSVHKIWKNGVATDYADTRFLSSVFVNQNNVYVSGWDYVNGRNVAKVWENDMATNLTDPLTHRAKAHDVYVYGNDVYVVGEDYDGESTSTYAALWDNGVVTNLNTAGYGQANAVFVHEDDVYVVGYISDGDSSIKAQLWHNGTATELVGVTYSNTNADDVFVYNEDVYVIGNDGNDDFDIAEIPTLWKNGVPTHITNSTSYHGANALYVHNDDTYVVGYGWNDNNISVAKIWINGEETALTDGSTRASAIAVFVK